MKFTFSILLILSLFFVGCGGGQLAKVASSVPVPTSSKPNTCSAVRSCPAASKSATRTIATAPSADSNKLDRRGFASNRGQ
jgi:hypothetical protein